MTFFRNKKKGWTKAHDRKKDELERYQRSVVWSTGGWIAWDYITNWRGARQLQKWLIKRTTGKGSEMAKKLKKGLENTWPICHETCFFGSWKEMASVFIYEMRMWSCLCRSSRPRAERKKWDKYCMEKQMLFGRTVVRQAGQLFLPVCNHSSTQVWWKAWRQDMTRISSSGW